MLVQGPIAAQVRLWNPALRPRPCPPGNSLLADTYRCNPPIRRRKPPACFTYWSSPPLFERPRGAPAMITRKHPKQLMLIAAFVAMLAALPGFAAEKDR